MTSTRSWRQLARNRHAVRGVARAGACNDFSKEVSEARRRVVEAGSNHSEQRRSSLPRCSRPRVGEVRGKARGSRGTRNSAGRHQGPPAHLLGVLLRLRARDQSSIACARAATGCGRSRVRHEQGPSGASRLAQGSAQVPAAPPLSRQLISHWPSDPSPWSGSAIDLVAPYILQSLFDCPQPQDRLSA